MTAAVLVDVLVAHRGADVSSQAGSFLGASAAFVVGVGVGVVVSQFTTSQARRGAGRAHLGDLETTEQHGQGAVAAADAGWYRHADDHGRRSCWLFALVLYIIWW